MRVALLAADQKGVVSRNQLRELGLNDATIDSQVARRRLHVVYRGIYAVGQTDLPRFHREMAAVLACGSDTALISHNSAAYMWGMVRKEPASVHVSVSAGQPTHSGITAHRVKSISAEDRSEIDGVPVTSPSLTLLDLAAQPRKFGPWHLSQAVHRAMAAGHLTGADILNIVGRNPGRKGVRALRAYAGKDGFSRSKAEDLLLNIVHAHGLPEPKRNVKLEDFEIDFLWDEQKLVVEVDGFQFHQSRTMFESDRDRDGVLADYDYKILRFTWSQITQRQATVARRIRRALASSSRA